MSRRSARGKPETGEEIPAKQPKLADIDDDVEKVDNVESVPDENEPPKPVVVGNEEATSEAEKESATDADAKSATDADAKSPAVDDVVDAVDAAGDKPRFRILHCTS